jgi:hypothetical protein
VTAVGGSKGSSEPLVIGEDGESIATAGGAGDGLSGAHLTTARTGAQTARSRFRPGLVMQQPPSGTGEAIDTGVRSGSRGQTPTTARPAQIKKFLCCIHEPVMKIAYNS